MIASLTGRLQRRTDDFLIVDVAGVGYRVFVPSSTAHVLPQNGEEVTLHIHTHLREDSLSLFGFFSELEKDMFLLLIGVSGIGPRLALTLLSRLPVSDIVYAIRQSDESRLCALPGIGKKTAARMILELRDKVKHVQVVVSGESGRKASGITDDAVSALVNLGYKKPLIEETLVKVKNRTPDIRLEELIKETLSLLGRR
ncbi:MAG: Holliday junction branch migration protein RuvA [Nitrospirota bacterium]